MVEELPQVYSQYSLIGVGSGFLVSFTANTGGASISESQSLGLISALRLSLIGCVPDDTKVSRSDDKTG